MTVQKANIVMCAAEIIDRLPNKEKLWKAVALMMTLDPYGNVFSSVGCTLYFPRRFSKQFLKKIGRINQCPIPFISVTIRNTKDSPYIDHIDEWETVKEVLDLLAVNTDSIPTTIIPHANYKKQYHYE